MDKHRVVVVGGGFAGLYATKKLNEDDLEVTLVDRRNFHLFQPLLYQVAAGQLSPGDIAAPLRYVFRNRKNVRVLLGEVDDIDVQGKQVHLEEGESIPYDSLIVATGAQNSYFGHQDWQQIAPGLKTIEEGVRIRHKVLYAFEAAERESNPDERRKWLTFVIVGGGPTGVELAGALGEIANDVLRDEFRHIEPAESRILLVEGSERVLSTFDPELSQAAEKSLIGLGVRTLQHTRVMSITPDGVQVHSEENKRDEFIPTKTVLWAAGIRAAQISDKLKEKAGAPVDKGGRVQVDPYCNVPGHPEIYVVGDMATLKDAAGKQVPGVAPAAMQMGKYAARTIVKRLHGDTVEPFKYFDKGSLAVIGRAAGVAQFGKFHFSGLLAWLLWLFVHLMYLVNFQNRLVVFLRWGFTYLTFNRGARLITGQAVHGEPPQEVDI